MNSFSQKKGNEKSSDSGLIFQGKETKGEGLDNEGFETVEDDTRKSSIIRTETEPPPYDHVLREGDSSIAYKTAQKELDVEAPVEETRMVWDNQMEFLMSCISMSVGLGNVWRFPFVVYENGGGAFLIPYFLVLIFVGRPIYFLELCMGQFSSYGQVQAWKCAPLFKGVGFGTMIAALCVLTYYCSTLALSIFYLFMSLRTNLPWATCKESWAGLGNCNGTRLGDNVSMSLPEMYFVNEVLHEADNIDDGIGTPDWRLAICLFLSWLVIYFTIMRGVKSSGKVAYFTAIFPYIVLIILLIRGTTLPGAGKGIRYFFEPDWKKIWEPGVWYAAVEQCFFSLNTGFGSIIMFASYNPFHHNIYKDSLVVSLMDTFTSLLAGITIFAILGNLAHELGVDVSEVVAGGSSMAFISYPDAIAKFDWVPQLFAVLFFMMLFTLGVGSAASDAGAIATIFCDRYPKILRWQVAFAICIFGFGVGLIYVTPGGQFMLNLVDFYGGGFVIYLMSTLEVVGIAWCYGLYNFIADIEFMLGMKLGIYWKFCWGFFIPIFLAVILVYSLVTGGTLEYNDKPYPVVYTVCGWIIAAIALSSLPVGALHTMWRLPGTFMERFRAGLKPKHDWGPRNVKKREEWKAFKAANYYNPWSNILKRFKLS